MTQNIILAIIVFLTSINYACDSKESKSLIQKDQTEESTQKIIIRCDDIGMSHSVNMALKEIMNTDLKFSASVIVTAPWFPEAVEILKLKSEKVAVGVHLCANSEWNNIRWRPILGAQKTPSLVDDLGYFKSDFILNWKPAPDLTEMKNEFRAQIEMAIKAGLDLTYIDGHMGVATASADFIRIVQELADEFNLVKSESFGESSAHFVNLGTAQVDILNKENISLKTATSATPYLMLTHPGLDTEESRAIYLKGTTSTPEVAIGRSKETEMLISSEFKTLLDRYHLQPVNYESLE